MRIAPIQFTDQMVLALLEGRKTQTRRIFWVKRPTPRNRSAKTDHFATIYPPPPDDLCPVGKSWSVGIWHARQRGDLLYVREGLRFEDGLLRYGSDGAIVPLSTIPEDYEPKSWIAPMHMPRWASRMWLAVTDVRVQRLQDITEADCLAEGPKIKGYAEFRHGRGPSSLDGVMVHTDMDHVYATPRCWFRELWDSLHDKPNKKDEDWEDDPWVVALTFAVNLGNIDRR